MSRTRNTETKTNQHLRVKKICEPLHKSVRFMEDPTPKEILRLNISCKEDAEVWICNVYRGGVTKKRRYTTNTEDANRALLLFDSAINAQKTLFPQKPVLYTVNVVHSQFYELQVEIPVIATSSQEALNAVKDMMSMSGDSYRVSSAKIASMKSDSGELLKHEMSKSPVASLEEKITLLKFNTEYLQKQAAENLVKIEKANFMLMNVMLACQTLAYSEECKVSN